MTSQTTLTSPPLNLPVEEWTLDELRPLLIEHMLPHVPFDGWTDKALALAAEEIGIPADRTHIAFPGGSADMVAAYIALADRRMLEELEARNIGSLKVRERITLAVRVRLEQATPHREAVRRALAILAMPQNLVLGSRTLWQTADAMWRAAGDTATDYNHYTKRLTLGGVYSTTLLVWLNDESVDLAETWAFLDRRIADVMRFEKTKAQFVGTGDRLPSLARFLGRLRYPAF